MNTMLDKIAAKLAAHLGEIWSAIDEDRRNHFRDLAQDCLEPLLYPDETMMEAGYLSARGIDRPDGPKVYLAFVAMMKAMFEERPETSTTARP